MSDAVQDPAPTTVPVPGQEPEVKPDPELEPEKEPLTPGGDVEDEADAEEQDSEA